MENTDVSGQMGGTTTFAAGDDGVDFTCTVQGTAEPPVGDVVVGRINLSNGATVEFAGTWS
ncbi:MAG: hypothetical protein HY297_02740 [Thaumarchaeota archaeon]|nr:hypothetical protein [Nitrososphaerota archaeon]